MVARMLCRSLSWMGWAGLAAVLAPSPELGAGLGLVAEAAAGAEGAGVARVEEVVEDGVTAADWLRELGRAREHWRATCPQTHHNTSILPQTSLRCHVSGRSLNHEKDRASPGAYSVLQHLLRPASVKEATPGETREPGVRLTWMKSCLPEALRSPVSWPGPARSGPPGHLQGARTRSSTLTPGWRPHPPPQSRPPSTTAQGQAGEGAERACPRGPRAGLLRRVLAA